MNFFCGEGGGGGWRRRERGEGGGGNKHTCKKSRWFLNHLLQPITRTQYAVLSVMGGLPTCQIYDDPLQISRRFVAIETSGTSVYARVCIVLLLWYHECRVPLRRCTVEVLLCPRGCPGTEAVGQWVFHTFHKESWQINHEGCIRRDRAGNGFCNHVSARMQERFYSLFGRQTSLQSCFVKRTAQCKGSPWSKASLTSDPAPASLSSLHSEVEMCTFFFYLASACILA